MRTNCRIIFYLFFMLLLGMSTSQAQALQDLRKGVLSAQKEVNKTKRDINRVKKLFSTKKKTIDPAIDTGEVILWSMKPHIPNSGMIKDYEFIYTFLHKEQSYTFKRDPDLISIQYDSINHQFYKNLGEGKKLKEGVEVMGWHPYWQTDAYKNYNYNLISILSYYAYNVNPATGAANNPEVIEQLAQSSLPDSTLKYGVDLYLSVSSFGAEANAKFLRNTIAQELFVEEVIEILKSKGAAFKGIDLDFEEINATDKDLFTAFVKTLHSRLNDFGYSIILDVPYFNDQQALDYKALLSSVRYFNIMGYDFNGQFSSYPNSIAPLHSISNQPSLETAVHDFLNLNISPQKIILSLPLYGAAWDISNIEYGASAQFIEAMPFYKIKSLYDSEYYPFYDPLSASFFYLTGENDSLDSKQVCWFENGVSLDVKMDWINELGLKGVGFWALGYDNNAPEIWSAVQKNFGITLVPIEPQSTALSGPFGLAKTIIKYRKQIGFGFLIFVGILLAGLIFSLRYWQVRETLFQSQYFRFLYSFVLLALTIFGLQWWWNDNQNWSITIGILVGASIVAMVQFGFTKYRNDLK